MSKSTAWVLTRELNQYDQDGEYFVAVFKEKPSIQMLARCLTGHGGMPGDVMAAVALLEHIRGGGGREGTEDQWFNLAEVAYGL